ncbi:mechanosensitive ion channel family protein [Ulvibacter antarcticus]|uniref:Small-conductance mechanosensitive channel n=1 Tax=Ulvibacter antarcticus TaxID=442714 RepID=A0A3L9YDL0_9FLAO|nr:mechanosensitive ion channel family protein [Ulvibacter antarcticus]RMA58741.1 small-conductance mechanosensitive channel [Ulvibacter antarcticus]
MEDFFNTYKLDIFWTAVIIALVVLLHFLTNVLHKWFIKQERLKFPGEKASPVNLVKRILNALWLVLGLIALSYMIVPEEEHGVLKGHFELVLYLGIVSVVTIVAATAANMWFKKSIIDKIENNYDPTNFKFLRYIAIVVIYIIGLLLTLLAFPSLRGVAQTVLGGAGVLALIIGVASQEALSNLIGGFFIISFKPFKIGDLVKVTDTMVGTVTDITLRHTVIRNFENKMIVIPNSIINKEKLINYDMGELKCCERIEIGISYDSNIDLAKKIMQEECEHHPLILDNRTELEKQEGRPVVKTALTQFNDSSMTIRAWAWGSSFGEIFQLKIDVLESIKKRFDKEGIEIPFPYRTIVMKKEKETLN